jgi:hypothetical protein
LRRAAEELSHARRVRTTRPPPRLTPAQGVGCGLLLAPLVFMAFGLLNWL